MKFTETPLPGAYILDLEPFADNRGFFARSFCRSEFAQHGLDDRISQCNISFNHKKGTLRGLHYQEPPHAEVKLVRCTRGAILDVIVDIRPGSSSFHQWFGIELTEENRRMLYVPEGCAHGYQTVTDEAEVSYQVSYPYVATAGRGIRWDDPAIGVKWPIANPILSQQDQSWQLLRA